MSQCLAAQSSSTVSLFPSPNSSLFGAPVTLTATVTPSVATGRVTFYDGAAVLGVGVIAGGQALFTTRAFFPGAHALRARYTGDASYYASNSASVTQTVTSLGASGFSTGLAANAFPYGIATGDFNQDGKIDLVVSNYYPEKGITILLGTGNGAFQPSASYLTGITCYAVAVADFDGDGRPDVAAADALGNTVAILRGNGDGTLQTPTFFPVGKQPGALVVSDFDGDGNADLGVVNAVSGNISILLGRGDGSFRAAVNYPAGGFLMSAAVGDFNGDGKPDLAVTDVDGGSVVIFLGVGDGTFSTGAVIPVGLGSGAVSAADLNGDGNIDLVVTSGEGVSVLLGNGDGTFRTQVAYAGVSSPMDLVLADLDGDGKVDIAIPDLTGNHVAVFAGNGDGTFRDAIAFPTGAAPIRLAAGDFNSDGRVDLAVSNYLGDGLSILLGASSRLSATAGAASVIAHDTIIVPPSLQVTLTHTGNFARGQSNATYSVTVSDAPGAAPTTGTVIVTETLPTGLTLVFMAGSGWSCTGNTCTRGDSLSGGTSYQPLTVTVNAAPDAPLHVTNQVTVSGGGLMVPVTTSDATVVDTAPMQYLMSTYAGGVPAPTAVAATLYNFSSINGIAADGFGNVYFSSDLNCVFKRDRQGNLVRVAGNCRVGYSGDGGLAVNAQLSFPQGVAADFAGNLYIADAGNHRIRKVDAGGIITTIAGTGSCSYYGDDVPASQAQLCLPQGVAVDPSGALFIADTLNSRVRKVTGGVITTIAGIGGQGFSGDGGPATSAGLANPFGVALDSTGKLYIADSINNRIRAIDLNGIITTVAGTGTAGYSGDGGQATSGQLNYPLSVTVDPGGTIYVADMNGVVRSVSPQGILATFAGTGDIDYVGDGGPAASAGLSAPQGVAADSAGNLFIADSGHSVVRKVGADKIIQTIAGNFADPQPHFFGDDGPATTAGLNSNEGVAVDAAKNLYIADDRNFRLRKVTPSGRITTVAGIGLLGDSGDGFAALSAAVDPFSVAVDAAGNIYLGEVSPLIRKIAPNGLISTVAGNGVWGYSGDQGLAVKAQIGSPVYGLAIDPAGNLYFSDVNHHVVRKVTPGGIISTVAGTGTPGFSGEGGPGTGAQLRGPGSLAADSLGNIYIADSANSRIRKLAADGTISTVAGNGINAAGLDGGPAVSTSLVYPRTVAVDSGGALYIGSADNALRKVSEGGVIQTIVPAHDVYTGDGGPSLSAELSSVAGLAVDSDGRIYVSDLFAKAVRVLQPSPLPLLSVSHGHSGNFAWGQNGATYSVTVRNAALAGPASGTVTLTETIPSGLSLVSLSGNGWNCSGNTCTRAGTLAGGDSYPPVIVTVNVAANALPQVTASATVSGGGSPASSAVDATLIGSDTPTLQISATHSGNFTLGQSNARYFVTVSNQTASPATSGTVTVTETLPASLQLVSMAGAGWDCADNTCTRSDALVGGGAYEPITVTTRVVATSPVQITNLVSMSGGNAPAASATDVTIIASTTPMLSATLAHNGTPMQGRAGLTYSLVVSNAAFAVDTSGPVTVTENIPAGLTLVSMAGSGWNCTSLPACTQTNSLASGASYLPITITVDVATDAPAQITNQVSLSGGGSPAANAADITTVVPFSCDVNTDGNTNVADVQLILNEALGTSPPVHDLNHDGAVNAADVRKSIDAALGMGCLYQS